MVGEHRVQLVPITHDLASRVGVALDRPHIALVGVEDAPKSRGRRSVVIDGKRKRILGMGGLYWREGLCWLWLGSVEMQRTSAIKIVRMARTMLRKAAQLGETRVLAARDPHPCSEKLLILLGFVKLPDHPTFNGIELWERKVAENG